MDQPSEASMRPRQMPRNFHCRLPSTFFPTSGFNEAAADAAEFSTASREEWDCYGASMRPRQMPRNFGETSYDALRHPIASMRPRQMPRNFDTSRKPATEFLELQ